MLTGDTHTTTTQKKPGIKPSSEFRQNKRHKNVGQLKQKPLDV